MKHIRIIGSLEEALRILGLSELPSTTEDLSKQADKVMEKMMKRDMLNLTEDENDELHDKATALAIVIPKIQLRQLADKKAQTLN